MRADVDDRAGRVSCQGVREAQGIRLGECESRLSAEGQERHPAGDWNERLHEVVRGRVASDEPVGDTG